MLFFMASTLDLDPSRLGRRNTYIFIIEGIPLATGVFPSDQVTFPLTRNSALARLQAFLPLAGSRYARMRNLDQGPNGHVHVSRLSAALRRRLISEEEVVDAVVARHGPVAAEKFICEVFWRTYWKGWLEQRPSVWSSYLRAVDRAQMRLAADAGLACLYAEACGGRSGIDCFNAWVTELKATGYLHSWARMQFASIWIFTLGLPWELGAAFMLEHLIDGDLASNTLSWRWVAGLHTTGKVYLADAERIREMTGGRFAPHGLAANVVIPDDSIEVPPASLPRLFRTPDHSSPTVLLLTVEDMSLETVSALDTLNVRALAVMPGEPSADRASLEDAFVRAKLRWPDALVLGSLSPAALMMQKRRDAGRSLPVSPRWVRRLVGSRFYARKRRTKDFYSPNICATGIAGHGRIVARASSHSGEKFQSLSTPKAIGYDRTGDRLV